MELHHLARTVVLFLREPKGHDSRQKSESGSQQGVRRTQTQKAGCRREQEAFREQLPDQPRASSAEREPDGHFAAPCLGAGEQEVGEIRAFSRIIKKLHANPPTENG